MLLRRQNDARKSQISECISNLAARKITLEIQNDFNQYAEIVRYERQVQALGAPFDHKKQFIPAHRGFWILGRNPDGVLMHTQAVRLLDLRNQNLGSYMTHHYEKFPPGGADVDWSKSWYRPGPGSKKITGQVAYHGEMWVDGSAGDYRGRGLVDILARIAFIQIQEQLNADHVFGYMLRSVARKGLAEREGYLHNDPYCLSWKLNDRVEPLDCNMVYMSAEDMDYSIDVPIDQHHSGALRCR
jgi:hypothetical protein